MQLVIHLRSPHSYVFQVITSQEVFPLYSAFVSMVRVSHPGYTVTHLIYPILFWDELG
jgi:hypothetical protein